MKCAWCRRKPGMYRVRINPKVTAVVCNRCMVHFKDLPEDDWDLLPERPNAVQQG